jgi:hypothetical protein
MNKLIIEKVLLEEGTLIYRVRDKNTIYLITANKPIAEYTHNLLKQEYNEEQENASKIQRIS